MDYLEQLELESLNQEQYELAETIGMEAFRKLIRMYGGNTIYIPKIDEARRDMRNDEIRARFTGRNYRQLGQEYGLTDVMIRKIVADLDEEMRAKPLDGQISLL